MNAVINFMTSFGLLAIGIGHWILGNNEQTATLCSVEGARKPRSPNMSNRAQNGGEYGNQKI